MFEGVKSTLSKIFKSLSTDVSKGKGTQSYDGDAGWFYKKFAVENTRAAKYKDYKEMENSYGLEISACLDAYADGTLRQDSPDEVLIRIKSKNEDIIKKIREINKEQKIPRRLWSWARCLSKNGDLFLEAIFDDFGNLSRIKKLPEETIYVQVDKYGIFDKKAPYVQKDPSGEIVAWFDPWQILHSKLVRDESEYYGYSVLDSSRPIWKKLVGMEDSLAVNRITRSRRYIHKIDITDLSPPDADERVANYRNRYKSRDMIDPLTGDLKVEKNPITESRDFFLGVTKDTANSSGVSILEENQVKDITDILYFRDKMLVALKVPKQWLNIDVKLSARTSSQVQSVFFAAAIRHVQLALVESLYKLYDICLTKQGIDMSDIKNEYQILLPKQETTDELVASRVQLILSTAARNYNELGVIDARFILEDILNLEQDKVEVLLVRIEKAKEEQEKKDQAKAKEFAKNGLPDKNGNKDGVASQGGGDNTKGGKEKGADPGKAADNGGSAPVRVVPTKKKEDIEAMTLKLLEDPKVRIYIEDIKSLIKLEALYKKK
jgi:hypothetical protein